MRLIDADALDTVPWEEPGDAGKAIRNAPTIDAVPVVRCKDCKHWNDACHSLGTGDCHPLERVTFKTFFCSYGERKGGEG